MVLDVGRVPVRIAVLLLGVASALREDFDDPAFYAAIGCYVFMLLGRLVLELCAVVLRLDINRRKHAADKRR